MSEPESLILSGLPKDVRKSKRLRSIIDQVQAMGLAECFDRRGELIERIYVACSHRKIVERIGRVSRDRVTKWVERGIDAAEKKFGSGKRIDRALFHRRRMFCQACENWKRLCELKGGKDGCSLLDKPCTVELRWMSEGDDWCPAGKNFGPPTSTGRKVTEFLAVTSLSRLPHHMTRQTLCLDSWKAFGLDVVAVNTTDEIEELRERYPQVDQWIESNQTAVEFEAIGDTKRTQYINTLVDVAVILDRPVLIINSDVELYGDKSAIVDRMGERRLVVGIRWNYSGKEYALAEREKWGLDAFVMTPEMVQTLPRLPFAIGRPVWDYWLPKHFIDLGYTMEFIGDPMLYHHRHQLHWSREEWQLAASWLCDAYVTYCDYSGVDFRSSLPFPPREDENREPRRGAP
jgi:hypothetical protein